MLAWWLNITAYSAGTVAEHNCLTVLAWWLNITANSAGTVADHTERIAVVVDDAVSKGTVVDQVSWMHGG